MSTPDGFDPYRKWLGIPPAEQPPHHYRLLGIGLFEDDADTISIAADRQMSHVRTFQTGPHSALSQKLLNELAAARVTLLSREKKSAYDQQLRAKLAALAPSVGAGEGRGASAVDRNPPATVPLPRSPNVPSPPTTGQGSGGTTASGAKLVVQDDTFEVSSAAPRLSPHSSCPTWIHGDWSSDSV